MGSRTLFALRVIRCPACHARLPVEGGELVVKCEYCDAHVQLAGSGPKKKKKKQPAQPQPPPAVAAPVADAPTTHTAQPHYSGFAWVVFLVPLLSVLGVAVSVFLSAGLQWGDLEMLWHDLTNQREAPTESVAAPERVERSDAPDEAGETGDETASDEEELDEDEPGRVGRFFDRLSERAEQTEQAEAEAAAARARARARQRAAATPAEPQGPVLSVAEAKAALEPKVRACMQAANVHHVTARMGNAAVGGVSILTSANVFTPRVDGAEVRRLPSTPLGQCMNEAGKQVRTRAFKSNYVIIDVRNPSVPNPLGDLPQSPGPDALAAAVSALDAQVQACAKQHGEEGRGSTPIRIRVDGPTGKLMWARPLYTGNAFNRCAEAVYRKGEYPKAQRHWYDHTHHVGL
jgi:hypothetical protein